MSGVFDSAHVMGDDFKIYIGSLMGCVLSPDRAKLLMNTMGVVIRLVARSVRLWACEGSIAQLVYCDDWLGIFTNEAELQAVWAIWVNWSLASGCRMGIEERKDKAKELSKTTVCAARWEGGWLVDVEITTLCNHDGMEVPRLGANEAYKHLGLPRTGRRMEAEQRRAAGWRSCSKASLRSWRG